MLLRLIKRGISTFNSMACSRYEYVKQFELEDKILPNVWIVIRVDGKGFHKFSKKHNFEKPNDERALNLMSHAAIEVMNSFNDVILCYGQSDEYSFVFRKETDVFNRRSAKLLSYVCSLFTSVYVKSWNHWFGESNKLKYAPCFDGRIVMYPSDQNLKDYLSWRQADTHINNLYNTAFWCLVQKGGLTNQQAEEKLRGTFSADKNELLFSEFQTNYNDIEPLYRKGTILMKKKVEFEMNGEKIQRILVVPYYCDMIRERFWKENPELLASDSKKERKGVIKLESLSELLKIQVQE